MGFDVSDGTVREYVFHGVIKALLDEGFTLAAHVTPESERFCQSILNDAGQLFFEQSHEDVLGLERLLANTPLHAVEEDFFTRARDHAYNLRGQAQLLGFTLITQIAGHMIACITHEELPQGIKYQLVRRITETLRLAFLQRIQDAGGPEGKELLAVVEGYLATSH